MIPKYVIIFSDNSYKKGTKVPSDFWENTDYSAIAEWSDTNQDYVVTQTKRDSGWKIISHFWIKPGMRYRN